MLKRVVLLALTVVFLAVVYSRVDRAALAGALRSTRPLLLLAGLAMFVPQVWVQALRWRALVGVFVRIGLGQSASLILASQTMNLVLPSKAGDLSKAVFLKTGGVLDLKRATNIVVFEKMLDTASLSLVMAAGVGLMVLWPPAAVAGDERLRAAAILAAAMGLALVALVALVYFVPVARVPGLAAFLGALDRRPRLRLAAAFFRAGHETIALLQARGARRGAIIAASLLIWVLHMVQIWLFFLAMGPALGGAPPFGQFVCMVPLAIFVGLLPVSIGGFGTRDAALIALFPQFPAAAMAAVALLVNLRYIIPALAGIPFLGSHLKLRGQPGMPPDNAQTAPLQDRR